MRRAPAIKSFSVVYLLSCHSDGKLYFLFDFFLFHLFFFFQQSIYNERKIEKENHETASRTWEGYSGRFIGAAKINPGCKHTGRQWFKAKHDTSSHS